jgi:hypothetical protein
MRLESYKEARTKTIRLLTPALSSFGEERENYFVGRLPRVALAVHEQPWANFRSAFSANHQRIRVNS